ncbi:MAG: hypothetical protein GWP50_13210 [Proteobacteria bacterium]|nr:hypothetical protein [Pseudomonadota bacterium]
MAVVDEVKDLKAGNSRRSLDQHYGANSERPNHQMTATYQTHWLSWITMQ